MGKSTLLMEIPFGANSIGDSIEICVNIGNQIPDDSIIPPLGLYLVFVVTDQYITYIWLSLRNQLEKASV